MVNEAGEATALLYRAVGLNEAADIERFGGFRAMPRAGFQEGKWFAPRYDDAVRWGKAMQRLDGPAAHPFRVAEAMVPQSLIVTLEFRPQLDAIGPAYFARRDRLAAINAAGKIHVHPTT